MNTIYIVIICLCVLFVAYKIRPNFSKYEKEKEVEKESKFPIIYGAGFCGYCTKQKDELDAANVEYVYYDCTLPENKEKCSGIKSYPTIKFPDQTELVVGKQPIDKFAAYIKK